MLRDRINFSCKHDVLIQNPDGTYLPMDTPYFESEYIAPGTWRIHSDGDAIYLVEGGNEAIVIDTGYGVGNIREYCQSLTPKPVRNVINTHDHFDHTANNAYFEKAYMTEATRPLATIPFPSFEGIDFPRDYPVEIVKEGDVIDLGGRTLEVIEIPDHAVGSIALLDRKEKILFSGDEIMDGFKKINGKVSTVLEQYKKIWDRRDDIDVIWPGPGGKCNMETIRKYIQTMEYILDGGESEEGPGFKNMEKVEPMFTESGQTLYRRYKVRACDMHLEKEVAQKGIRHVDLFGVLVIFSDDNL